MSRPRVLILGATGLLGSELTLQFSDDYEVIPKSHNEIDITDSDAVGLLIAAAKPRWVINAAAYSDVDGCETDSVKARAVNTAGAIDVARACQDAKARLVFFSSDYVFDGRSELPYTEESGPNPINVYGTTKVDAERGIQQILPEALIIRTSWLYGDKGRDFVKAIVSQAKRLDTDANEEGLKVVEDQVGCPTSAKDLVAQIKVMLESDSVGLYHCTGIGQTSWYDYACIIVDQLGLQVAVEPFGSAELGRPAKRPAFSVLDNARLKNAGLNRMPDYKTSLIAYLQSHRERLLNEM